jgi:hypothetical protein
MACYDRSGKYTLRPICPNCASPDPEICIVVQDAYVPFGDEIAKPNACVLSANELPIPELVSMFARVLADHILENCRTGISMNDAQIRTLFTDTAPSCFGYIKEDMIDRIVEQAMSIIHKRAYTYKAQFSNGTVACTYE